MSEEESTSGGDDGDIDSDGPQERSSKEEIPKKLSKSSLRGNEKQKNISKKEKGLIKKHKFHLTEHHNDKSDSDNANLEGSDDVMEEEEDQKESEHLESKNEKDSSLNQELSHMSFEELQELKERLGLKMYNQAIHGNRGKSKQKSATSFKRANKNRPLEMSSKRPVRHDITPAKDPVRRDPRFDDLSGEYDEKLFKQSYGFLDKVKERDRMKLAKKLQTTKNETEKETIQKVLGKMTQQAKTKEDKEKRAEIVRKVNKKEKEAVSEGKTPFYLKNSEKRKLELAEKFKELKKSGKLENYLAKKRKKNASKERKNLPFQTT